MVATLVFTVILVVVSTGVIRFTNDYYRGVNNSSTQAAAQNAMDFITQAIQYSNSSATNLGGTGYFCAGNKVFMYSPGKQFGGSPSNSDKGLYMMTNPSPGSCANPGTPSGGSELLSKNMRLAYFKVTQSGVSWTINMEIAYGDNDLLCRSDLNTAPGGCRSTVQATDSALFDSHVQCKTTIGSQFCAVARLDSVATPRL